MECLFKGKHVTSVDDKGAVFKMKINNFNDIHPHLHILSLSNYNANHK